MAQTNGIGSMLADAIRERRESLEPHKTQEDIAFTAGVSVRHYQKIEAGTGDPKFSTLYAIAEALETTLQDLLDRADTIFGLAKKKRRR